MHFPPPLHYYKPKFVSRIMSLQNQIAELLDRGVSEIHIRKDLEEKLRSGKKLRVKLGIDPSGSDLTLGHAVVLRKMRQFQDYGHHVILLFGTFTGKIGDPTGKSQTRKPMTDEEIAKNMATYIEQAGTILDVSKIEVVKNGDWLKDMTFENVLRLAGSFTVQQMLHRDMFCERMKKVQEINLVEFLYPLMQGYDSVAIKADLELGGTDQTFNLLAGRQIMKAHGMEPQNILTVPILEGLDGKEKMSKSLGNYIALLDSPRDMFGKTMSIPDHLILRYFVLATTVPLEEIKKISTLLKDGENPRNVKARLAREIVSLYHGESVAKTAEEEFNRMFQEKGKPDDMMKITLKNAGHTVLDLVIKSKLVESNSEARRLIQQGAVRIDDEKVEKLEEKVPVQKKMIILQVGKRKFCRIVFSK